jgi:uncharacterized membrane protein YfbV (UPF0208 family)
MIQKYTEATIKAAKEVKYWAYAAWTLPFVALSAIVFEQLIGWEHIHQKLIVVIAVTFFSISVFWWWWALHKFVALLDAFRLTEERFVEVKDELRKAQEILKDVGDR